MTALEVKDRAPGRTDANGHVIARAFDGANRLIAETRGWGTPDASTVNYTLDADGNKIETSNPRTGTFVAHDDYDALNRLVRSEDPLG